MAMKNSYKINRLQIPGYWIADYIYKVQNNPKELILLLHGYSESAEKIFDRLINYLPSTAAVLAPCGLFPIPQRKGGDTQKVEHEMGYSWYFYNFRTDEYVIDMGSAIHYLIGLIRELKLEHLPLRIIGFSQGGYLAPFVGLEQPQTRQVIGISSRFLEDEFPSLPHFRMDAVHGEVDEVIECKPAEESHRRLLQKGVQGKFIVVPNVPHRLTFEVRKKVRELLDADLSPGRVFLLRRWYLLCIK
jgi:predicted esterase